MTEECCFLGTSNSFKEVANRMLRHTAQKLKAGNKRVTLEQNSQNKTISVKKGRKDKCNKLGIQKKSLRCTKRVFLILSADVHQILALCEQLYWAYFLRKFVTFSAFALVSFLLVALPSSKRLGLPYHRLHGCTKVASNDTLFTSIGKQKLLASNQHLNLTGEV